ncbi:MAG: GNAT family N-acetyltransferase [Balneolaceae bacterium]
MLTIVKADYANPDHADTVLSMTSEYARDPMGMEEELEDEVKENLIREMSLFPGTMSLIAYLDGKPAGLANCVYSFSTFAAKKVLNVHDLAVLPEMRGQGIGRKLLEAVIEQAQQTDCCKVTLEVREDNRARRLYERCGFSVGDPAMYFMTCELDEESGR